MQLSFQTNTVKRKDIISILIIIYFVNIISKLQVTFFPADCCVREGVSAACLPACYPSTVTDSFDYNQCEAELLMLIKCGTGKMSHITDVVQFFMLWLEIPSLPVFKKWTLIDFSFVTFVNVLPKFALFSRSNMYAI